MRAFLIFSCCILSALADTPANCTFDDVAGTWTFYEGPRGQGRYHDCSGAKREELTHKRQLILDFPNTAVDKHTGEEGTWTIVYNQGFEVNVGFRKYFAFSKYENVSGKFVSYCSETLPGWSHDTYSRDWACYMGLKEGEMVTKVVDSVAAPNKGRFRNDRNYIRKINSVQKSWKATPHSEFDGMPADGIVRLKGGHRSRVSLPKPMVAKKLSVIEASRLPSEFDWRNVRGQNFVSPIRNQGHCGSCFAFASMAMLEARFKIMSNNTINPVFSPQDVVNCTSYSQGCDGGFPYLIGGKYAENYGVVLESCDPYDIGGGRSCMLVDKTCRRFYATDYRYIGDFYGGCNEELMKHALVTNGPFVVGFEVYDDFMHYKTGVYHHTGLRADMNAGLKYNPFEITNHAVLVVGYGTENGEDYWLVKNSWGPSWGDNGFFKIRRGNDECGIESLGFESTPLVTYLN